MLGNQHVRFGGGLKEKGHVSGTSLAAYPTPEARLWAKAKERTMSKVFLLDAEKTPLEPIHPGGHDGSLKMAKLSSTEDTLLH